MKRMPRRVKRYMKTGRSSNRDRLIDRWFRRRRKYLDRLTRST